MRISRSLTSKKFQKIVATDHPVQAFSLEGGNFLEVIATNNSAKTGFILSPINVNRQEAIESHRNDSYHY
jgi:hypothetical protein